MKTQEERNLEAMAKEPLNEWAEIVGSLANDCLSGLITWDEKEAELRKAAHRMGFHYEG